MPQFLFTYFIYQIPSISFSPYFETACSSYRPQVIHFLVVAAILGMSSPNNVQASCRIKEDNSTFCSNLELNYDEPAKVDLTTNVVNIHYSHGSISSKTLTPFQNAEILSFDSCDISRVEDGALGSLPNLKELYIIIGNFPTITKGILRGCHKLQKFRTYSPVEVDAFQEISNVEDLELSDAVTPSFTKAYLEPLKHLKTLYLELGDLSNVIEPGLFCASPVLENLKLRLNSPITLTESLFNNCNSMRKLYITGDIVVDGNIFSKMSNLEEVEFASVPLKHITKEFLTGVPNLKVFEFTSTPSGESKIDGDAFENLPHLTRLKLSLTQLHDSDLQALYPLSELVTLNLRSNKIENPESLPYLPNLEHLNLDYNSIERFSLDNLKKKTPKLKTLKLIMNPILPGFIAEEFRNQDTITVTVGRIG